LPSVFIITHGYGYDVEYITEETVTLVTGLQRGDLDVDMESWTENIQEVYDKGIREVPMLDLGTNYPDSWQGWPVPTYMIKGDKKRGIKPMAPGLKSVLDLPKYWKVFRDPETPDKGRFYRSPGRINDRGGETGQTVGGLLLGADVDPGKARHDGAGGTSL
jgi:glycine betaine/proline transport system substrate-binding protein